MGKNGRYFEFIDYNLSYTRNFVSKKSDLVVRVKVSVNSQIIETASSHPAPIHAFENALRQALLPYFSVLSMLKMVGFDWDIQDVGQYGSKAPVSTEVVFQYNGDRLCFISDPNMNSIESGFLAVITGYQQCLKKMLNEKEVSNG